jgi:hypothetical protein
MTFNRDDPNTWPHFNPLIIAHDVARSRDHSTAVIGGNGPFEPRLLGIKELIELPKGYGSKRASDLAAIDRRYDNNSLIVFDASNDPTYAETLYDTFGAARPIGLHITSSGDGMNWERRPVKNGSILVYTIGRSHLLELFHTEMENGLVRFVDGPMSRRAFEQLVNLETELREGGIVYRCPSGQHDDLGMSCAMLAWAARHPHLPFWVRDFRRSRVIRKPRETHGWGAFV